MVTDMELRVAKFGGTSLADSHQFCKVKKIVEENRERRYIIPSAPGKSERYDVKVTDLLYNLESAVEAGEDHTGIFDLIKERFLEIKNDLGLKTDIDAHLEDILKDIKDGAGPDYAASRGEYLNGLLLAEYLGFDFVDAKDVILFDKRGKYDERATEKKVSEVLKDKEYAVIPGFYGSLPNGSIKTFSRGGSDITGAIVAAAVRADLYENWTDVSGGGPVCKESGIRDIQGTERVKLHGSGGSP